MNCVCMGQSAREAEMRAGHTALLPYAPRLWVMLRNVLILRLCCRLVPLLRGLRRRKPRT